MIPADGGMGTGLALYVCRACSGRFGTNTANLQSEFGDGYGARFVGLQGLPDFKGRSGTDPVIKVDGVKYIANDEDDK